MRTVKWNAFLSGLSTFAVALGVMVSGARADVTVEKGSSILIFPKVRATQSFDTIIQLTNTGNSMVHAHCYYVNASLTDSFGGSCTIPGPTCTPLWQETDFDIWLTRQQPTHWLVSTGRRISPFDAFGSDGAGFDPGLIPPMFAFEGELKCIEVTEDRVPLIGNHLKGEATIKTVSGPDRGDVSKYNAVGILGNPDSQPSNPLVLDGHIYDACPERLFLNHFASGADDPVADLETDADESFITTELTLVPCSEDFETQTPKTVTIQFLIFNEFEERFSASTTVTCFLNTELTNIDAQGFPSLSVFSRASLGTDVALTQITPVVQPNGDSGGLIGVAEMTKSVTEGEVTRTARAAVNLHTTGSFVPPAGPDTIRLIEQVE